MATARIAVATFGLLCVAGSFDGLAFATSVSVQPEAELPVALTLRGTEGDMAILQNLLYVPIPVGQLPSEFKVLFQGLEKTMRATGSVARHVVTIVGPNDRGALESLAYFARSHPVGAVEPLVTGSGVIRSGVRSGDGTEFSVGGAPVKVQFRTDERGSGVITFDTVIPREYLSLAGHYENALTKPVTDILKELVRTELAKQGPPGAFSKIDEASLKLFFQRAEGATLAWRDPNLTRAKFGSLPREKLLAAPLKLVKRVKRAAGSMRGHQF